MGLPGFACERRASPGLLIESLQPRRPAEAPLRRRQNDGRSASSQWSAAASRMPNWGAARCAATKTLAASLGPPQMP